MTSLRVMQRRLGTPDHRADARDLPLTPGVLEWTADCVPEEPGCVGGIDHELILLLISIRQLKQRPTEVEQLARETLL
jgi:hypothetical protein